MRLISRSGLVATALAIGAIAAPSAQASTPLRAAHQEAEGVPWSYSHQATIAPVVSPNPDEQYTTAAMGTAPHLICTPRARSCQPATTSVVSTAQNEPGFQYDDAAIGAGVMVGLGLLGIAGTLAVRRRGQLHDA